ncbi:MAG: GatB/YqeY domain-containing protein [bacterium]|nr:GatB/YqeY domain-containing protein [bacterium]
MQLKQQIESDFLSAYKSRDDSKVSVLRLLKSAIKNAEINTKSELPEPEIIKILRREVKQREESIFEFEKGGRSDLVSSNQDEIKIINAYLPAQIGEDQIKVIVNEVIAGLNPSGPADFGRVMGAVMKKVGTDADGATVAAIIKKSLK